MILPRACKTGLVKGAQIRFWLPSHLVPICKMYWSEDAIKFSFKFLNEAVPKPAPHGYLLQEIKIDSSLPYLIFLIEYNTLAHGPVQK